MPTTQFEEHSITSFVQEGTGIPLVFIHGFCEDSSIWNDFIARFPGRSIVRIDLPGFGESGLIANHSMARYAAVVHQVLQDLKVEPCILIGHSMGGYVALELAKQYPATLRGLCLFHSQPYADTPDKKEGRQKSIDFIRQNGHIYYVKQLFPALFTKSYQSSNHLELAKLVFKASHYSPDGIIAGLEGMISRADNRDILSTLEIPFLFIIGKEDTVVPDYLEDTARPDIGSIHVLDNVAHMGMLEQPKICENVIKEFAQLVEQFT